MSTSKERVLQREKERGYLVGHEAAQSIQTNADSMTGTELYAVDDRIPSFEKALKKANMLDRPAGFTCKSTAGRVVRLIQPYDSTVYTQEPEELPAQWGFKWSTDPAHALPFIALATSPFNTGECCTEDGKTYRSKFDGNVHAPSAWPDGWEEV
jgi:hypothetical protein